MHCQWYHKLGLGGPAALWLFFAANMLNDTQIQPSALEKLTHTVTKVDESKTEASNIEAASTQNALSIIAATEVSRGAKLFDKRKAYHTLIKGENQSYADLDAFLANPKRLVPGAKMVFAKLKKPNQRANILVYLQPISGLPKTLL